MKKLFLIQIDGTKTFYVEAETQEAALDIAENEENDVDFDYESFQTAADEVTEINAARIRKTHPEKIYKPRTFSLS